MLVDVYMLSTIIHHQLYSLICIDWTPGPMEQPVTGKVFPRNLKECRWKQRERNSWWKMALCWQQNSKQDSFPKLMLSSVHSVNEVEIGYNHHRTGHPITKPEIVHEYNKFMGAVDRYNQMVAYSCFRWRSMKWWKKVFFHLFSWTILNAYILHKERTRSPLLQRA